MKTSDTTLTGREKDDSTYLQIRRRTEFKRTFGTCQQFVQFFSESVGVSAMSTLVGLLHDMGKGTNAFQTYLRWWAEHDDAEPLPKHIKHHKHAPTGAIYAYDCWFCNGNPMQQRTALIIVLCIYGHHTGLMDCVDQENPMRFQTLLEQDKNIIFYQEAVSYFLENIADETHLDHLFASACEEFRQKTAGNFIDQISGRCHAVPACMTIPF